MKKFIDVSDDMEIEQLPDGESLSISKCVCGYEHQSWDFILNMDDEGTECENCHRKFKWCSVIKIYEVKEE